MAYARDIVRLQPLGAIDPGVEVATEAGASVAGLSPFVFFCIAVAAGVTTWWITSKLAARR
jgi:hypothetical protein